MVLVIAIRLNGLKRYIFYLLDKKLEKLPFNKKQKTSGNPEALLLLAGVCENRTHQGRDRRPTTGFEDQEHHQAPSTPMANFIIPC